MKKFFLILTSIFLLLSSFALGFFVNKSIDDRKILNAKKDLESINNNLQNQLESEQKNIENEKNKKENIEAKHKHQIDIEEEKCIASSHVYDYFICGEESEKSWDKEIENNINLLQKVMTKEEFDYIETMNDSWNKSVNNQKFVINRFISSKDGIIYKTDGQHNIVQIKRTYALLLKSLYYNCYEEDKEFLN